MGLKRIQVVVHGRVQGVFFRATAQREARQNGLTGWVKNRRDGAVEMSERRLLTPAGGKASSPARRKPPSPSRAGKSGRAYRPRSAESM